MTMEIDLQKCYLQRRKRAVLRTKIMNKESHHRKIILPFSKHAELPHQLSDYLKVP